MKNKTLGNKLFKSGKVLIAVAGVSVIPVISTVSANTNKVTPVHTASNWRANDQTSVSSTATDQAAADKATADKAAADKAAADKAAADKAAADKAAADKAAADKATADKAAADKAAADKATADKAAADKAAADKAAADKAAEKVSDQVMNNLVAKPQGNQLNIYNGNTVVETLGPGTWENMAFAHDSSAINNINGYLSYTGWYRPYGTSQDGKTWYQTTATDWRPLLMHIWPNKDVQAQFIKYFVKNGYENANYGLTKVSVANLNKDTDATVLNTTAQNLRYVIEQSIATNKGTGKLANDINGFADTVPELSASSELPYGQVIFVNNDNTSYADSKYRLMSRTINNQTGNDNSDNSYEFLTGIDIDNSNPVVQAENLNWEYFLLNYGKLMGYNPDGNFDGFRIDAADHIDADVLDQMGQLMDDMYHMKGNPQNANNHLSYNEGYRSGAARMLNKKGNPQLYMDYVGSILGNVLGRANNRDTISNLITGSIVNRQNDVTENEATPNWSFVTNHDQRANLINGLIIKDHPGAYKVKYANQAWQEFYADQKKTDKQYAQYNVPAQYAILLSNKDTVPQIYYGDLYNETAQYMQEKSIYYDAITTLMKARKQFVSGGQTMTKLSDNLIASVRYGKGVANANSEGTDSLSRTSGMAVIVGNNPQMAEQTISINMGRAHANEQYRKLLDTTDNGLTYNADGAENPETLTTDDNGILKVTVKGYSNPYVSGYLGVWVPVVSGNQDVTTNSATVSADSNKIFESNAALDSHMIYQDFSLYQPEPTSTENHAYNIIAQNAELFNNLGITDFWMAPPYTQYSESRYNDGYSVTDRYNLGTNANQTKYGSGEELANAIAALHSAGLKVQVDIVMNQMIGLPGQEAVTVTRADNRGMQTDVNGKTYANQMYFAYTTGGGNGQETYGGKYLSELQSKYPDLFTTRAISTGVAPDPTTRITKWSAKYENGTSLQNIGIGLAVKLPNGEYAYLRSSDNKSFNTLLPSEIDYKIGTAGTAGTSGTWLYVDGQQFYYIKGKLAKNEQRIAGKWYLFDTVTGAMKTSFQKVGSKQVYYGNDGIMRYGEQKVAGKWYLFDTVTGAMKTGFQKVGSKQVYYGNDGIMRYGEQKIAGKWYLFDTVTGAMKN